MNITSPVDIESTLESGRNLAADVADALGTKLETLEARAGVHAADLLPGKKEGRSRGRRIAVGAVVLALVVVVLRRMTR
ncbi:MAG: hypothetical protein JWQ32_1274 [Marmoricola sp.]|nr:hypothetical protein [Marmoricola sp.]